MNPNCESPALRASASVCATGRYATDWSARRWIAGWGVREATMMVAFGYAGLNQTDGTMVSLLSGMTSFVVGILGGLVWILSREKREKVPDAIPKVG